MVTPLAKEHYRPRTSRLFRVTIGINEMTDQDKYSLSAMIDFLIMGIVVHFMETGIKGFYFLMAINAYFYIVAIDAKTKSSKERVG